MENSNQLFFIDSLNGSERANLMNIAIQKLNALKVNVAAVTFD